MPEALSEQDIFHALYVFGGLTSVKIVRSAGCAFVDFASRELAANAIAHVSRELVVGGHRLSVGWASRPKPTQPRDTDTPAADHAALPAPPGLEGAPESAYSLEEQARLGPDKRRRVATGRASYPSMNPARLGSAT